MDFNFCLPLYGQFPTTTGLFTYRRTILPAAFYIIAYHLNAHIMLLRYVICNYIWHMGSLYYELLSQGITFISYIVSYISSLWKSISCIFVTIGQTFKQKASFRKQWLKLWRTMMKANFFLNFMIFMTWVVDAKRQDRCHQWPTRPDPQSRQ